MKITELRVGNWVKCNSIKQKESIITGLTEQGYIWFVDKPFYFECAATVDKCKPIPLTEQWLEKFGFKKEKHNTAELWKFKDVIAIKQDNGLFRIYLNHTVNEGIIKKYVHTLQNLYFAIKEEELTIKK